MVDKTDYKEMKRNLLAKLIQQEFENEVVKLLRDDSLSLEEIDAKLDGMLDGYFAALDGLCEFYPEDKTEDDCQNDPD